MEEKIVKKTQFNIWMFFTMFLLAIITIAGSYYLGTKNNSNIFLPTPTLTPQLAITASPYPTINQLPSVIPVTPSVISTISKTLTKTIDAGLSGSSAFLTYKINVPSDWAVDHQFTKDTFDDLKITRGAYKIVIMQGGGEGLTCLYGNEQNDQFTQKFKTYVEFNSLDETFRRSGEIGGTGWTLCHKIPSGWGFPSIYGYISYVVPANTAENILKEMDSIIGSITKQ